MSPNTLCDENMPPILPIQQPLSPHWLAQALTTDTEMYPSPLTLETLTSWIDTCPTFALQYVHPLRPEELVGVCIVLPIYRSYWRELVDGRIHEWDVGPGMLWRPRDGGAGSREGEQEGQGKGQGEEDREVGLHVWHIERFPHWEEQWGRFGGYVWRDIQRLVDEQEEEGGLKVIGCSALAVTEDGARLFRDGMGWGEAGGYRGQWVVARRGKTRIVEKGVWEREGEKEEGWEVVGNCMMFVKMGGL